MSTKWKREDFTRNEVSIPDGMGSDQFYCNDCFAITIEASKKKKIADDPSASIDSKLGVRVSEYKKQWNKNGIVEYKDDYCAILQRKVGSQVEFIIAFSDLTKEGYRCIAQDGGKDGGTGGLTGGINSYYYFQNMKYVSGTLTQLD